MEKVSRRYLRRRVKSPFSHPFSCSSLQSCGTRRPNSYRRSSTSRSCKRTPRARGTPGHPRTTMSTKSPRPLAPSSFNFTHLYASPSTVYVLQYTDICIPKRRCGFKSLPKEVTDGINPTIQFPEKCPQYKDTYKKALDSILNSVDVIGKSYNECKRKN